MPNALRIDSRPARTPAGSARPPRTRKVLTLILVNDGDSDALEGLTEEDRELVSQFSAIDGPTNIFRIIAGARSAGFAISIRTDLPAID